MSEQYAIYLRKSRDDLAAEERGEGDTLQRHRTRLLALGRELGLPIAEIYEEVVSGDTIAARPEIQRLLRAVEQGRYAGVLCMEVARLARGNTADQGVIADTFKYSRTKIITPGKTYDPGDEFDEEYFEFGLFMSRREYKMINRRLQRGRMASLEEGKYIAGAAPYGYERYKLQRQKGYSLRIVPEDAEIVREIFRLYCDAGMGSLVIARELDRRGIPSPSGGRWSAYSIRDILRNPTYAGLVRWGYRPYRKSMDEGRQVVHRNNNADAALVRGLHEAIIPQPVFDRAQALLAARNKSPVPGGTEMRNPLCGLVYCGACGTVMSRRQYQRGRPQLLCPCKDCRTMASPLDEVEADLLSALRRWLDEYKLTLKPDDPAQPQRPAAEDEAARLEKSLAQYQRQLDSLYDLVEQGTYSVELFKSRSAVLSERIAAAKAALAETRRSAAREADLLRRRQQVIPRVEHALEVYHGLSSPAEKNALLKTILDRAVYTKTKGGRWAAENDMKIVIFPLTE